MCVKEEVSVTQRGESIIPPPNQRRESKLTTNLPSLFSSRLRGMQSNIFRVKQEDKVPLPRSRPLPVLSSGQPRRVCGPREEYSQKKVMVWPTGPAVSLPPKGPEKLGVMNKSVQGRWVVCGGLGESVAGWSGFAEQARRKEGNVSAPESKKVELLQQIVRNVSTLILLGQCFHGGCFYSFFVNIFPPLSVLSFRIRPKCKSQPSPSRCVILGKLSKLP